MTTFGVRGIHELIYLNGALSLLLRGVSGKDTTSTRSQRCLDGSQNTGRSGDPVFIKAIRPSRGRDSSQALGDQA